MNQQYITVKEFARRAHKSPQAIYKRLNNQLSTYVKLVDNQKMLNIQALQDVYGIEIDNHIQQKVERIDNQTQPIIELLEGELETLRDQLTVKDNQIMELNARLRETLKALNQAQQLQALSEKKIKLLESQQIDDEPPMSTGGEKQDSETQTGFFKRFFKKSH